MSNIVGEGFDKNISDQVEQRQKTHGSGFSTDNRTLQQLAVLNNNTAWVKLMSSVFIDELTGVDGINNPTIAEFKTKGIGIAKAFVLFNGTSAYNNKTIQREGIDFTNTLGGYNNVYGIGGSADFGLNPMMGITGIDVKHKNRGSIRTATVTVKAFNRAQFEIIDILYMRLGFSVLLEWGNSIYMNNKDEYVKDGGDLNSLIDPWFKEDDYITFLAKIRKQALLSNGNYDAMLAKVSNYHWSFKKDGSYDITIDLVSMGDIIESLNAGKRPNGVINITLSGEASALGKRLENARLQSKWGEELFSQYQNLKGNNTINNSFKENIGYGEQIQYHFTPDIISKNFTPDNGGFLYIKLGKILQLLRDKIVLTDSHNNRVLKFDFSYANNLIGIIKTSISSMDLTSLFLPNGIVINQMSYDPYKCITLKKLAPYIKHYPGDLMGNKKNDGYSATMNASMVYGDTNKRLETTYAPINLEIPITGNESEDFDYVENNTNYGRIMNILINAEFLLDVVENKTNKETGELPLIDFLKGILQGINESLGGINELDVFIDETTNTVKIIDTNPLPGIKFQRSAIFNLYGYNNTNNTSNFIHDFELKTEITPALSTMITVAATSNKTVVGADNTALSKINKGLYDRYKKILKEDTSISTATSTGKPSRGSDEYNKQFEAWLEKYTAKQHYDKFGNIWEEGDAQGKFPFSFLTQDIFEGRPRVGTQLQPSGIDIIQNSPINHSTSKPTDEQLYLSAAYGLDTLNNPGENSFWTMINHIYQGLWIKDKINAFNNSFKDVNKKWNNFQGKGKNNPEFKSGFIPFNLSLTMDGLSGMKIYQKFSVDTNFMPSNYPENIEFLIKNIQHTVKDNKWITKLESFCVSKPGYDKKLTSKPNVTGIGLGIHSKIAITSNYKEGSVKATYTATIESGEPAEKDIVITFTDTLKNIDPSLQSLKSLDISITISKGTTTGTSIEYIFLDAIYGAIEQSSTKSNITFLDNSMFKKYYFQVEENVFEPIVVLVTPTVSDGPGLDPIKYIVAKYESGGNYDAMYRTTGVHTYEAANGVTSMTQTIATVISKATGAVGKYQNLPGYIEQRAKDVGLSISMDLYNEVNQEKMGDDLMLSDDSLGKYLKGTNGGSQADLAAAVQKVGQVWASCPITTSKRIAGVATPGNWGDVTTGIGTDGYYNDGINPATTKHTVGDVVQALIRSRIQHSPSSATPYTPSYYVP